MPPFAYDPQSQRFFEGDPQRRRIAAELYASVAGLPILSPHGHVDPRVLADPDYSFGTPTELMITPDHYVFRMLYSHGVPLEKLGIPRLDGSPVETDPRKVWQIFADHFYLFRGTPTGIWISQELRDIFSIPEKLTPQTAQAIYDQISDCLSQPEYRPRALYERFNLEALCTTDAPWDTLAGHQAIRESGWPGRVIPTYRPDGVANLERDDWRSNLDLLGAAWGAEIGSYAAFIRALEDRRAYFKQAGATACDHGIADPRVEELTPGEAETIFQRALHGRSEPGDAPRFAGHLLLEMARMSCEDGLVMQIHPGAWRSYDDPIAERFGPDKGADIPKALDFTHGLRPLLNRFGADPRLTLVVFTLDETVYSRELAPLAGLYPALRLGPPWWFHDSLNGMARYFDQVIETAGLYNTAGFNDDTRAFCSIPVRHDLWRRAAANWLAGLVAREIIDREDGLAMAQAAAYGLAKETYHL